MTLAALLPAVLIAVAVCSVFLAAGLVAWLMGEGR
jgi:hypothetical protein